MPSTVAAILSPLTGDLISRNLLNLIQEYLGSVPVVHVADVCRAHIFCMKLPSIKGRFCCAAACPSIKEITRYLRETYPEYKIHKEWTEGPEEGSMSDFNKLKKMGFEYRYGFKEIIDDSVAIAMKLNESPFSLVV